MAGRRECSVAEVGTIVVDALASTPVVLVSVDGSSAERCADELVATLRTPVVGRVGRCVAVRMARTDVGADGAFAKRRARAVGDGGEDVAVTVVLDAQWADDTSLGELTELASAALDGAASTSPAVPPLVVMSRAGSQRSALAEMWMTLRRRATTIDVLGYTAADVKAAMSEAGVDLGVLRHSFTDATSGADLTAQQVVDASHGAADLIDALIAGELLQTEVVARLAVLDTTARSVAEALAFGADLTTIGGLAPVVGGPDALDAALTALTVEGLVSDAGMAPWVADATRRACTPARRHSVVDQLVEFGPAGLAGDIAAALLAVGDRTPRAAEFYLQHATALAATDPAAARAFADAATAAGADSALLATIAALGALADGDPIAALRHLHDQYGPDVELVRATAWSALGDLDATAEALSRSTTPLLSQWATTGSGARGELGSTVITLDAGPGAPLVRAVDAWLGRPVTDTDALAGLFDDLRRATVEFRTDPDAARWPVSPDLVAVLIAARLGASDVALRTAAAAVNERPGGEVHRLRHRLVAAWLDARRGVLDAAAAVVEEVADADLAPYDRFLLEAVRCAIAVRDQHATDVEAAAAAAAAAADALGPNLYLLDLVTDVVAAAVRCRVGRSAELFTSADRAVAGLGAPQRARLDLAIARMRAAMAGDDVDLVRELATSVLAEGADLDPNAPAVATAALPSAMLLAAAVLTADADAVDVSTVVDAASRLATAGAPHEAARLCGLMATATSDANVARVLLKQSRNWRAARASLKRAGGVDHAVAKLSEQEERVAKMVSDGHTYKQIGAVLFVSPKTVEHHVAHIRTKLGCSSRAEMLAALRDYFGTGGAA